MNEKTAWQNIKQRKAAWCASTARFAMALCTRAVSCNNHKGGVCGSKRVAV